MYSSGIPTKLDRQSMTKNEWVKARTQELYDMLPLTTLEERNSYVDIRDEIIRLNYSFFGYVAKNQHVTDPLVKYEDKLQSVLTNFCEMWAKYKFTPKYRDDLSFAVFFKPRLSECVTREFNIISYSLRRTVCIKAGKQLGKPWTKVTVDDIPYVHLNESDMRILEAVFNAQYTPQYEDIVSPILANSYMDTIDNLYTEEYDNLEDLIVHEMIEAESTLDDAYLLRMAEMYCIPYEDLKKARPIGEAKLKQQLEEIIEIQNTFESETDLDSPVLIHIEE